MLLQYNNVKYMYMYMYSMKGKQVYEGIGNIVGKMTL